MWDFRPRLASGGPTSRHGFASGATAKETAVPGASIVARLSSVVYDAIAMKKVGHKFLLVRGVLEVAKTM